MKIAVINFSGNVGKTTVARHRLLPRIAGAEFVAVETINAGETQGQALRGRQFGELQEYLQTVESAVVDIGASNVEELLALMRRYRGSHEDFDAFVVPTAPALKQQQDAIATLVDLSQLGVEASRLKLVFNMVEDDDAARSFFVLRAFLDQHPIAEPNLACRLGFNEIYRRINGRADDLTALAHDDTDYRAQIVRATDAAEKTALAQKLATQRLARGVLPELDTCFAALALSTRAERSDLNA
jgi:hypothetical protein